MSEPSRKNTPQCGKPETDFGDFITSRGIGIVGRAVAALGAAGILFLAGNCAYEAWQACLKQFWLHAAGYLAGAIFCLWWASYVIRRYFHSHDFYERGMVRKGLGFREEFPYEDAVWLEYSTVRYRSSGIPIGSYVYLRMGLRGGRRLWLAALHQESKAILRNAGILDELDLACDAISIHIADRLEAELKKAGSVTWCGRARIETTGIVPLSGSRKKTHVGWREVNHVVFLNGEMHLSAFGDKKPFLRLKCAGRDFYPCLRVVNRLRQEPSL